MANLYQVNFVQGKTDVADFGQVKHSLTDTETGRAIISLSISADKLQSVSNYSREPKRLVFECFVTDWIRDNILAGTNEYERYISHFEVKAYRDGELFFTGIIDTSQMAYDISTDVIKFTCYDKIKLLSVYSDLTHYYSLTAGYLPRWILQYFVQDIQQTIPISIPISNALTVPYLAVPEEDPFDLVKIDYTDMSVLPADADGWIYSIQSTFWTTTPRVGYILDTYGNKVSFIFAHFVLIRADKTGLSTAYQLRSRGKIYRYFNLTAPIVKEYDERSEWFTNLSGLSNIITDMHAFFNDNMVPSSYLEPGALAATATLGSAQYSSFHLVSSYVKAFFYGAVLPVRLHPGKAYETLQADQTDNLRALQAMLMLYNATVYSNPAGQIVLKSKDAYSTSITDIADDDVVSFVMKRANMEMPDTKILDVLAGDTAFLQGIVKDYLIRFYDSKWSVEATIDQLSKYSLALQSKIRVKGQVYAITELERDYINDEYKVKAWHL